MKAIKTSKNNPQRKKKTITSKKLSVTKTKITLKKIPVSRNKNIKKIQSLRREDWLKKSHLLFHLNPAPIALVSLPDRKYVDVNEASLKMTGYTREEIIGKTSDDLKTFVDFKEKEETFKKLLEQGHLNNFELRIRRKDGNILDGLFSAEIIESRGKMYLLVLMMDMTSRKLSEKTQREKEEKYRTILETTEEGYYEIDLAGNFTFFNDPVCKLLGYSEKELMGMNNRNYTDKETAKKVFQAFNRVYKTGKSTKEFDWQIIRKDGTKRYIEQSASLQKDSSGKPVGFRGILHDITERKKVEESLKKTEALYRLLSDNMTEHVWIMNLDLKSTYVSPSVERTYGYTSDEILKLPFKKIIMPESLKKALAICSTEISRALVNPPPRDYKFLVELECRHKDGHLLWIEDTLSFIQDEKGKPLSILGETRDITERKQTEELLKQSEEKYRLLADHVKDQVWLMDLNLKITYISPSVEKTIGYTLDDLKQYPLDKILAPASFKEAMIISSTEIAKSLADTAYSMTNLVELEFIRKNGQALWMECAFSFIRDENGKPLSILGEGRDITERKQMEYSLKKSEENFRHSLDDSPLGVRIVSADGETLYANNAILDIYGYNSIDELINTPLQKRYTKDSYADFQLRQEKRDRGESGPSEYEISIVRKDGEIRHIHALRKEIFWSGQKQSQVIYQDITERREAEEKLKQSMNSLRKSISTTIQVLGIASEARDPYTAGHQRRVADLARAIATEMNIPHDIIEGIRMSGAIHDIGKISIPSEILCKPTVLTDLEFSLVKAHCQYSYEIIKDVESPWPLADIVYQHHERMDGSGYPQGLKGKNILIEARILAVADVVEAMMSYRPYRPALGLDLALAEIENNAGILYDRKAVKACLKLFREKGFKL